MQTSQKLRLHGWPIIARSGPTPSEQRRSLTLKTIEETSFSCGDQEGGRTQQSRLTGKGYRLRDDAVMSRQLAVEFPRLPIVAVLIGRGEGEPVQGVFGERNDFIAVVNTVALQSAHEDSRRR